MDDLVKRLRNLTCNSYDAEVIEAAKDAMDTAADRIEQLEAALQRANASLEYYERKFYLGTDRIEQLEAALQKYADEEYNGYNACGKHARAALAGEKADDAAT